MRLGNVAYERTEYAEQNPISFDPDCRCCDDDRMCGQ